ncbi:MAG TPA: 16S rRNA (uracil(1498)-N(3))-methyltransferase [Ktedonobacter sp.]|nr:16S rRNA (uracil(1498)-N(3))-methyltransferase [Ktedonobacter sp.]
MHRFFVPAELLENVASGSIISLPDKIAHQVRDVLHLAVNEQLVLLDNSGWEYVSSINKASKAGVEVQVIERRTGKAESPVNIILCQGLLKSARFEWVLEKGTELGVSTFAPILCRRSMSGLEDAGSAKLQRWQRILQEATEQCGRTRIPELLPIHPLIHALNDIPNDALAIMPWEEERGKSLRDVLQASKRDPLSKQTVVAFIGPEGGLMAEEVQLAQRYNVQAVTLGQRILRAETAALATIANIMYELDPML